MAADPDHESSMTAHTAHTHDGDDNYKRVFDLEDTPDGETTRKKGCGRSSWAILGASALGLTLVFFLVVVIVLMQSLSKLEQNADLKSEGVPSLGEDHVNRDQLLSGQIDDLNDKV